MGRPKLPVKTICRGCQREFPGSQWQIHQARSNQPVYCCRKCVKNRGEGIARPPGWKPRERHYLGVIDKPMEGDDRIYDDAEREFLDAISRYKRTARRPFPSWSEALAVLKGLGYRKQTAEIV